ncbi:MAG TPA: GLPGLI family protein [Saprospiraceae bacterium]|nr:GLPGLI family protein [Saprospiraceae bacterium]HMQ85126.1 GLPGLI family protein [Saprospiraceae bacterium]
MKQVFLFLLGCMPAFLIAQTNAGQVTYQETVKLNIELPEEHKGMIQGLPSSQSFSKTLYFNETESLYKDTPEKETEGDITISQESDGMNFKMVMKRPEESFYTNSVEARTVFAREFFGRDFLIVGALPEYAWKLTSQQKTILGYVCQKATFQDSTRLVEAWFTIQIPLSFGPDAFNQLPGLVLEVNINNGERTILAQEIVLGELEKGTIEVPKKGKTVTQAEFDLIEAEKMKELEQEMGGQGGGMRMIIRN